MSTKSVIKSVVYVKNQIVFSGQRYPEIARVNNRITCETVKQFLFEKDLITLDMLENPNLDYQVIAWSLLKAFQRGLLSLNATKQTGIINNTPLRLSSSLEGKMKDVWAFSTLSLVNPFCLRRMQIEEFVCSHCYVKRSLHIDAILNYIQNFYVLSMDRLPEEWIPVLNPKNVTRHPIIRLESMGDLCSKQQATAYIKIADRNSLFNFAIWTKNPKVFADAVDESGKPVNLSSVLSMSKVNTLEDVKRWDKYFDHRFAVVDDTALKEMWLMNPDFYACQCGPRSCITCQKCYHKDSTITTAVEMLRK